MAKRKGVVADISRAPSRASSAVVVGGRGRWPATPSEPSAIWFFGVHAALAVLANRRRRVRRLALTAEVEARHGAAIAAARDRRPGRPAIETATRKALSALLPEAAAHQGIAVLAEPLAAVSLDTVCRSAGALARCQVVVLDQVSDPHNVGAVMRSAAAFGSLALVM